MNPPRAPFTPPPLPSAPSGPTEARRRAILHASVNQLAFPGLGSIAAGRRVGYLQAAIMLIGFFLTLAYMFQAIAGLWKAMSDGVWTQSALRAPWRSHLKMGLYGFGFCAFAWLWSLFTSLSILRRTRRG